MMAAGDMHDRIGISQPTTTQNRLGETLASLGAPVNVFASVRPQDNAEQVRNGINSDTTTYAIRIRYRPGVTNESQIIYRGQTLDVYSLTAGGYANREWIDIVAKEKS